MRIACVVFLMLVISAATACKTETLPESSLTIRESVSNLLLATSQIPGSVSLANGEVRQVRIMRTYTNSNGNTQTDDVTQFANFKWDTNIGVAAIDQLGNISATGVGTATLEVKFRASTLDPWDICRLVVTVN